MTVAVIIWSITGLVAVLALLWAAGEFRKPRRDPNQTDEPSLPEQNVGPGDSPIEMFAGSADIMEADKAFGYNRTGLLAAIYFWALLAAPFGYLCRTDYWSADRWMCRSHVFDIALIVPYAFTTAMLAYWVRRAYLEGKRNEFRSMLRTLAIHSFWGVIFVWVVFG